MKRYIWFIYLTVFFLELVSCSGCSTNINDSKKTVALDLSVVSYNVQEFFDGKKDGCEYEDYRKGTWGTEPYKIRLERLCQVLRALKADIFVFQEIENEGILQDISNFTAGDSWRQKDLLSYSCFAKTPGSAIGVAVLSRYPISNVKIHSLDIRTEKTDMPSLRPILQVTVQVQDKEICLLANHWKSKSGGEEKTEIWRNWQESLLANVLFEATDQYSNFIICGDFNRDLNEFCKEGEKGDEIKFRGWVNPFSDFKVYSAWISNNGSFSSKCGSYFFNNSWEKIDHIFYSGNIKCEYFSPQQNSLWTDENGHPFEYRLSNGNGYSDHLPVKAVFKIM